MNNSSTFNFEKILMDGISDMVFVIKVEQESDFIYDFMNRAAMDGTGLTNSTLGKSINQVYPPQVASFLIGQYKKVVVNKESVQYTDSYITPEGNHRFSKTTLNPLFDERDTCRKIVAVVKNITERIISQRKLQESEERFRIISEHANDLITLLDEEGKISYASPSHMTILGLNHKEEIDKDFLHNVHPDDKEEVKKVILQSIQNKTSFAVTYRQFDSKNNLVWSDAHGSPVLDNQHHFKQMVVITRDINMQKEYEAKLEHLALHDSLTGLPNRLYFNELLNEAIERKQHHYKDVAVLMLDIDHFKKINDQFGHDVGDYVIEEFGQRLKQAIREQDIAARLGGDEFVILLRGICSINDAITIAKRINRVVQQPWTMKGTSLSVTTSIGIALSHSDDMSASSLLKEADIALYKAKNGGRNSYCVMDHERTVQK